MLCRLVALVRDAGIEPALSRLKGECISISANPAQNLVGDAGIEPAWFRLRGECISHLCQSPVLNNGTNTSRLPIARSAFELILQIQRCAVRELNPHRLGAGQLFSSVELPAQSLVEGAGIEPA